MRPGAGQAEPNVSGTVPTLPGDVGESRVRRASKAATREAQVVRFVATLSRAIHSFHTYPAGSPARGDVIEAVRQALSPCVAGGEDSISVDVTNEGLKYAGEPLHIEAGPERMLVQALRQGYVSTLEIEAGATTRDFRQFCALMAFPAQFLERIEELPEILAARGVSHVIAHVIPMHQTIEAGTVPPELLELVESARQRRDGLGMGDPAEGGWIRIDPSVPLQRVALEDLPLLLRDAPSLAVALQQLTGQEREAVSPSRALAAHYAEITELYSDADPAVAETLFRRLADVVQALPAEAKIDLLNQHVLPGLVDGRRSGRILRYFSEEEVSNALWLLLDLGVGGVEMLSAGIANLDLPESRVEEVVDGMAARMRREEIEGAEWLDRASLRRDASRAGEMLTVDEDHETEYAAFRAFDLSVDDEAAGELARIVEGIEHADPVEDALQCCADVLGLTADPSVIASVLRRSRGLFFDLESRGEVRTLAAWLALYARTARSREEKDGEAAALVRDALAEYVTPEFIHRVSALPRDDGNEPPLVTIICELGATGVGALVDSLATESDRSARNRLLTTLQPRSGELAGELVEYLSHPKWFVVRNILTLVGHAGQSLEGPIAACIDHEDPRVVREALLALARIGSEQAIGSTIAALRHPSPGVRRHALDAVWRYAPELSHPRLLEVMADPSLASTHPELLRNLVIAAGKRQLDGLDPVLRRLRWNCLAVWSPGRRALGQCAIGLLRSSR